MGAIKEEYTRYECDLCGEEIEQKHPHTITTKFKIKYLCQECIRVLINSLDKEDIKYYFKEGNIEEKKKYDKKSIKKNM